MALLDQLVTVEAERGLHILQAQRLVGAIRRLDCEVHLEFENQRVNGKSIMGILTLAVPSGMQIRVIAEGPDADRAVEASEQVLSHD